MGTRGLIGTAHDGGFTGRYVHQDSYPSGLGQHLLEAYRELGSTEKLIEQAVRPDAEGYWLNYCIDGDWTDETGEQLVDNTADAGAEWAYLIGERGLQVVAAIRNTGKKAVGMIGSIGTVVWETITTVPWDEQSPDWEHIECGDDLQRCIHYAWVHFPEAKDLRVGTAVWLGREAPGESDLVALIDTRTGRRLELTGSGGTGSATEHSVAWIMSQAEMPKVRYWWSSVKDGEQSRDVRAFRQLKGGGYKLEPYYLGVARIATGEMTIPAGTVLQ